MQMALDEVLLTRVLRPTLRIYRWSAPWITFGYFQEEASVIRRWPHLPRVRRWTGGGMVAHGDDLTFSLILPKGEPAARIPATQFYHQLHALIAAAFATFLGNGLSLVGREEERPGEACFSSPSRDDLIFDGKKVLGGAQRRSGGALLYQGSLQAPFVERIDTLSLARLLAGDVRISTGVSPEVFRATHQLASERYGTEAWNNRR